MELQTQTLLPSPSPTTSTTTTTTPNFPTTPKQQPRSDPSTPYPTTFVQADTSSFKQVVQMLTGSTTLKPKPNNHHPNPNPNPIPPIKTTPNKSKLYERRSTTLKNLRLTTTSTGPTSHDILSPSLLDFPSLVLSPVTPLTHDPFVNKSPISSTPSSLVSVDEIAEQKAIAEKGFFLHPSPVSTPRDSEPRLLTLFPLSSPKTLVTGSSPASS